MKKSAQVVTVKKRESEHTESNHSDVVLRERQVNEETRREQKLRVIALCSGLVNGGVMLGLSFVPAIGSDQSMFRFLGITIFLLVAVVAWLSRRKR